MPFLPVSKSPDLVSQSVRDAVLNGANSDIWVSEINADLADTATFCRAYDVGLDVSANCVIVQVKRSDEIWYAACIVLATT